MLQRYLEHKELQKFEDPQAERVPRDIWTILDVCVGRGIALFYGTEVLVDGSTLEWRCQLSFLKVYLNQSSQAVELSQTC